MELHDAVIYGFPYKLRPKPKIARTSLYLLVSSADRRDEVCEQDQFTISAVSHVTGHGL